jgi:putative ATPase
VAKQYLPDAMQGRVFYKPGELGYEMQIKQQVERRREAQLAAMIEGETMGLPEVLTFSGDRASRGRDQWLQRAISGAGQRLAGVRDRVLDAAQVQRHHLVLDLNAGSGLLTWDAMRRAPEGGVVTLARSSQDFAALQQQIAQMSEVERPTILQGGLDDLPGLLQAPLPRVFDAIVGRNALTRHADKPAAAQRLATLLAEGGAISLAEAVPSRAQRLYKLIDLEQLGVDLAAGLVEAEEAAYHASDDAMVNWDEGDLHAGFAAAGLAVAVTTEREQNELLVTPDVLARWFSNAASGERASYVDRLRQRLSAAECAAVEAVFRAQLSNRAVAWETTTAYLVAKVPDRS